MASVEKASNIVTTKKEKDPRRVEAGKRLAAISKQAKERKKKERQASLGSPRVEELATTITLPSSGLMLALTTASVVVALATLWYTRKEYQLSTKGADKGPNEVTKNDGEWVLSSRSEDRFVDPREPQGHSVKGLDSL